MAFRRLINHRRQPTAPAPIERYLTELDGSLRGAGAGAGAARRAIIDEFRDGLCEAARAHRIAGMTGEQSLAAAITEFGHPHTVAAAFAPELAARDARRVAGALVRSGPLIGVAWGLAALASGLALGHTGPWTWPVPGIALAFPLLAAAITVSAIAAAIAHTITGRLGWRWDVLGSRPRLASTAAATVAIAAVMCDLTLLALLGMSASTEAGSLAWPPVSLAATASLARLALAARAARRLLTVRSALN